MKFGYYDTFANPQGCHINRGALYMYSIFLGYFILSQNTSRNWKLNDVHRERARRMQERLDEIDKDEKVLKQEMKRAIKKEGDLKIFDITRRF